MAVADAFDNIRETVEGLNQRERRLLMLMALVFVALLVLVPIYLGLAGLRELEEENQAITEVLQDISRKEGDLLAERAERRQKDRLYERKTPALGSFLEQQAEQRELDGLEVTDQPELTMGSFTRRSVRASLARVDIKPFVHMLADIKNSRYPVAIERIQISGGRRDNLYSAKFGVNAYDSPSGRPSDAEREDETADEEQ